MYYKKKKKTKSIFIHAFVRHLQTLTQAPLKQRKSAPLANSEYHTKTNKNRTCHYWKKSSNTFYLYLISQQY